MLFLCRCNTCFLGHFGRRIRWKLHCYVWLKSGSGQIKLRSNQVISPITKFSFQKMSILSSFDSIFQESETNFFMYANNKCQKLHKKKSKVLPWDNMENTVLGSNSFSLQVCWRYGIDWYWNHWVLKPSPLASVACVLLSSATFQTVLGHCALAVPWLITDHERHTKPS